VKAGQIAKIYELLHAHYGDLNWWPGTHGRAACEASDQPAQTPYEVMVGAVLTQNTAWGNVEKAIANFATLSPEVVAGMEMDELIEIIRPSGFFNQKAVYLKSVTRWFASYDYAVAAVQREPFEKLRTELFSTKGVGKETADSILLYAFGFPTFVVDAYTIRLCERLPIDIDKKYDAVKAHFEASLDSDAGIFNNYHAMIVINAKEHCRKKPKCDNCPLQSICKKMNISGGKYVDVSKL